jgi:hypothetical protein
MVVGKGVLGVVTTDEKVAVNKSEKDLNAGGRGGPPPPCRKPTETDGNRRKPTERDRNRQTTMSNGIQPGVSLQPYPCDLPTNGDKCRHKATNVQELCQVHHLGERCVRFDPMDGVELQAISATNTFRMHLEFQMSHPASARMSRNPSLRFKAYSNRMILQEIWHSNFRNENRN